MSLRGHLVMTAKPNAKKSPGFRGADHIKLRDICVRLDMAQSQFADALGLVTALLASYEPGQTKKVPFEVMDRAEELAICERDALKWSKHYDHRSMLEILDEWGARLGANPTDLPTMAALTGTFTSTICAGERRMPPVASRARSWRKERRDQCQPAQKSRLLIE